MNRVLKTSAHSPYVLALLLVPLMMIEQAQAADNLSFKGTLVAEPCTLRPGDDAITFDIDEVSTDYLYANNRTNGTPFKIHLEGCDTSIAESVTTTFSGAQSPALPGLLALDGSSVAGGIALGIETLANVPLPLNVKSEELVLSDGDNTIEFNVYIKGEPQALEDMSIRPGLFSATSTFTLAYP